VNRLRPPAREAWIEQFSQMIGPTSRRTILLIAILALATVLDACAPKTTNENEPSPVLSGPPKTSLPMPPSNGGQLGQMGWILSDGAHTTISSYQNKILLLDFYATWCMPCRDSIPHLIALEKQYGPRGLAVVGLNVGGPGDLQEVPAFAQEFNIQYPLGVPDESLTNFLMSDIDAIPQTFVFDGRGQLIKRYIGYSESMANELDELIRSTLESSSK
jgi:thiol-disulfide isomerase/thioredoxin